jgi:hypothetical protein
MTACATSSSRAQPRAHRYALLRPLARRGWRTGQGPRAAARERCSAPANVGSSSANPLLKDDVDRWYLEHAAAVKKVTGHWPDQKGRRTLVEVGKGEPRPGPCAAQKAPAPRASEAGAVEKTADDTIERIGRCKRAENFRCPLSAHIRPFDGPFGAAARFRSPATSERGP